MWATAYRRLPFAVCHLAVSTCHLPLCNSSRHIAGSVFSVDFGARAINYDLKYEIVAAWAQGRLEYVFSFFCSFFALLLVSVHCVLWRPSPVRRVLGVF